MRAAQVLLLVLLQAARQALVGASTCDIQVQENFNQYPGVKSYTEADMLRDFPRAKGPFKELGPAGTCTIKEGNIYGFYPKGKIGGYDSGFTWYSVLPKPLLEATMDYDVYFQPGFDWTDGGKLPGLCGADCPVGCTVCTPARGWSTRLMWQRRGGIITYAYYPDKPKTIRCGQALQWAAGMQSGQWYHLTIYNKMNTPGKKDGHTLAWMDNRLVLNVTNFPFRYNPSMDYAITRAYFTTYVGGSSIENFAPDHDQWIKFDNFVVREGYCPNGRPAGSSPSPTPKPPGVKSPPPKPVHKPPPKPAAKPPPKPAAKPPPKPAAKPPPAKPTTKPPPPKPVPHPPQTCMTKYQRCGGFGYSTCCAPGTRCIWVNQWYSHCM